MDRHQPGDGDDTTTRSGIGHQATVDWALAQVLRRAATESPDLGCYLMLAAAADAFVFSNAADGSQSWFPDSVSRSFKCLCEKEGVPDVRLHDLRHFVATQLLSAGVDVRTAAGRLGHRNAATTLSL